MKKQPRPTDPQNTIKRYCPKRVGHEHPRAVNPNGATYKPGTSVVVDGLHHPEFASGLTADSNSEVEEQPGFRTRKAC